MDGYPKLRYLLFLLPLAGCGHPAEAPFTNWLRNEPSVAEGKAGQILLDAGLAAERVAGPDAQRVSFTPGRAAALMQKLAPATEAAAAAARQGAVPEARFAPPFQALPGQAGWRMIGRTLVWRIECAAEPKLAVEPFLDAVRFGLALSGGGATDASLGYTILQEAEDAFATNLDRLESVDLRRLGTGVEAALAARPKPERLLANEAANVRYAVQGLQNAYRDRELGRYLRELGRDTEPAIEALEALRSRDPKRRVAYFQGMMAEADARIERARLEFSRNARQRAALPKLELSENRPWWRFSRHFFTSLESLPATRDQAVCRLRLAGLQALLHAECKANGRPPGSLTGISKELSTDPYTGTPLVYQPDGATFRLYSVGPDFKDDGGEEGADIALG